MPRGRRRPVAAARHVYDRLPGLSGLCPSLLWPCSRVLHPRCERAAVMPVATQELSPLTGRATGRREPPAKHYRVAIYIVISKPKRMSSKDGLDQFMMISEIVFDDASIACWKGRPL